MEEWIDYHLLLGVDHFYLYDNSKSIGRNGSTPTTNKYNINFLKLTADISDEELDERFNNIISKYKGHITVVDWQPKNKNNEICYGQKESILHYLKNTPSIDSWTAFVDIDEFIFSRFELKNLITILDFNNFSDIILHQRKFDDRFNNLRCPVTKITKCIAGLDTSMWAPKHIIKHENFDTARVMNTWNIHHLPVICGYNTYCDATGKNLRFNHYNTNAAQLEWMDSFYKSEKNFAFNSNCTELLDRYNEMRSGSFK
ncbi:glycosyltransferase family 92 protein [Niabella drilacis]|uniref:glycosyltransferase family 92 protein n=1 Tax=Niabella drilacis (strain DSM 25811 / CCM 8410 / CCUG 62505 / LMG 26954 / E90) TaxID=1285928 RepID=UPI0015A0DF37|nr:glycosyltransferase family 92 protein [Niabella drilacis]